MTRKQKRLAIIGGGVGFIVAAVLLVMVAFSQAIAYFYVPGDLAKTNLAPGTRIRLGGLVENGSLKRGEGMTITFSVTDTLDKVPVTYTGILPDLFREGQGVVTEGTLIDAASFSRRQRARQARRELHAQGSGRRIEEAGSLEGRLRQATGSGEEMIARSGITRWSLRSRWRSSRRRCRLRARGGTIAC
jgi:cytochrome c-type biogenesis protein CcmE